LSSLGVKIVATVAFFQAMATKSFLCYNLHGHIPKHICTRIAKYCQRGFDLLLPIEFDGDFTSLMAQEDTPIYRIEHDNFMDEDGEIRIITREFVRLPQFNVDTYQVQEAFMHIVAPEFLLYDSDAVTEDE
jgi:hypothetical protein